MVPRCCRGGKVLNLVHRLYRKLRNMVAPVPGNEQSVTDAVRRPVDAEMIRLFNYMASRYERYTLATTVKSRPYLAVIDPSSFCNLQCPICPTGTFNASIGQSGDSGVQDHRALMSPDLFDCLIEDLGPYLYQIDFYNWGEPMLNKNLPQFVAKAKRYGIWTSMHTNLSHKLTDEALEELLCSGIDYIGVSLDGFTQETYATYRRKGNFELAKGNLLKLKEIRDRLGLHTLLNWLFLVFSFNEHEMETIKEFCDKNGLGFERREASLGDHVDWLPSYRKSQVGTPGAGTAMYVKPESTPRPCDFHYGFATVNPDGSLSPCCGTMPLVDLLGKIVPGEVRFQDVWNSELMQVSRSYANPTRADSPSGLKTLCANCSSGDGLRDLYAFPLWRRLNMLRERLGEPDAVLVRAMELFDSPSEFVPYYVESVIPYKERIMGE